MLLNVFSRFSASTGGGSSESITSILTMAGELFTWLISQMGALITFIFAHPLILLMVAVMLCGLVVGMFLRILGSVRS